MRNELHNIEIIEKYLRDELSATDKKAFEDKLKTDTKLQEEVELQKDVIKGIERVGVKQSIQTASRRYDNRRRGFFLGLFIVVIVSGVVGINYLNNNPEPKETISEDVVELKLDSKEQIEVWDSIVEVLDEEEINSEVVSFPKKKFQYFTINSSKDATITGAEGTKISFKANSFNVANNTPIKIRLKEYYKMSDIAFSNLTTETVDGKLLETGGMIYLDALANNKKLDLKENTFFDINFPFDKKKKDMILFDGKTKNKNVVWEKSKVEESETVVDFVTEEWSDEVFTIVEVMPEFKGGQKKLFEYLSNNTIFPPAAKANYISGKVYINFTINKDGNIENVRVIRGVHPLLDAEAIRVVKDMPNWSPGIQRGKAVSVSYSLPINFILDGATPLSSTYNSNDIKYNSDSLRKAQKTDTEKNLFGDDGIADKKNSGEANIAKADITSYALSGSRFGWINCDRFAGRGNLTLAIKVDSRNTEVKIIFHSIKSLIAGKNNGIYSKFGRVPSGEIVTVFAVKYVDKKPYVCLKELTTSTERINLEFEELTKEKLKQYTKEISSI